MLILVLYFAVLFLELLFAIGIFTWIASLVFSSFMGAPYVPTKKGELDVVLKEARLKKGQRFIELGCGDGRVVKHAVEKYKVHGVGVDVNPILILYSAFLWRKTKNLQLVNQNIYKTNLFPYDVIYVFLMPEMLEKLKKKFLDECRRGTLIISHGFKIPGWDTKISKTLSRKPFPTYFYKV